jgi:type VI secretion system protein ImpM
MAIPPPELDPQEGWFQMAEDLLLSALEQDAEFEKIKAALEALPPPADRLRMPMPEAMFRAAEDTIVAPCAPESVTAVLSAIRAEGHARSYAGDTFWWTAGGEGFRPLVMAARGMPHPHLFSGMLNGGFATMAA